jgi:iron uptake system component EfeO
VSRSAALTALSALTLSVLLGACGSDASSDGSGVALKATNDTCEVEQTSFDAGKITFNVKNDGSKVTEVYVYGANGDEFTKVISEVENIGPGTSRELTVTLDPGSYQLACKPGQTGHGIRQAITVGGRAPAGTSGSNSSDDAKYDREIELTTDGSSITGLNGAAKQGEKIEFKLENDADGPRTLEIKAPAGDVAGEVDIQQNAEGELIVELHETGTWKIIVEGGASDLTADLTVS